MNRHTVVGSHSLFSRSWNDANPGPAVVLLHGLSVSSKYMVPLGDALASEGFAVYAPELPGYGYSSKPKATLNTRELAHTLLNWMDAMGLEFVTVVANSYGCQIAAEAAALAPERFQRLLLVGAVDDRVRHAIRLLLRGVRDAPFERARDLASRPVDFSAMGMRRFIRTLNDLTMHKITVPLRRAQVPVTIIRGEHDPISPQEWAELLAEQCSDEAAVTVPAAGHDVHFRRADVVAALVKNRVTTPRNATNEPS